jgi:hypothetical protein
MPIVGQPNAKGTRRRRRRILAVPEHGLRERQRREGRAEKKRESERYGARAKARGAKWHA